MSKPSVVVHNGIHPSAQPKSTHLSQQEAADVQRLLNKAKRQPATFYVVSLAALKSAYQTWVAMHASPHLSRDMPTPRVAVKYPTHVTFSVIPGNPNSPQVSMLFVAD